VNCNCVPIDLVHLGGVQWLRSALILWVTHERSRAHATLGEWLSDPAAHEPEIGHAIHSIRDGLVVGYGTPDSKDAAIRGRCQQFAGGVVAATAAGMQRFFDLPADARTETDNSAVSKLARLLDETVNQYYFASGAFRERQGNENEPLRDPALKAEFLNDNYDMFRRVGDVGTKDA
jgi:hypothetical protein